MRITEGSENLIDYKPTEKLEIQFCGTCGVGLFTRHTDFVGWTYISFGTLIDDHGLLPQYHQFVGSKAKWHVIADGLPQFEEWD